MFQNVSWLVLIMLGVDLISHDKWLFYHFMSLETIESMTNSCQLILKHVIMTMHWQLFLMQASWTCPPLVCFLCPTFFLLPFLCCVFHSGLQITILQMGGWRRGGGRWVDHILCYIKPFKECILPCPWIDFTHKAPCFLY